MVHLLKSLTIAALVFTIAALAVAQTIPSSARLKLEMDCARFRGDENSLYVEVYYAFPQRAITFRPDTAGYRGGLIASLSAVRGDSVAFQDRWIIPHVVKDTASLRKGLTLTGMVPLGLGKGDYLLTLTGQDLHDSHVRDSITMTLHIQMLDTHKVILSDLEVANVIRPGEQGSPFYKNTLEVVPNVGAVFADNNRVYYYVEAYNLLKGDDRGDYKVKAIVLDAIGREMSSKEKVRKRSGESSVIVDEAPTKNLNTGTYTLVVALLDSSKNILTSAGKKFYVYNPSLGIDSTLSTAGTRSIVNMFSGVQEADLDREFEWLRYTSSESERAQYKELRSVDSKRTFMSEFWGRRSLGEREEFLKRVGHANSAYQVMGREGYKTDRGRVYLMYGPPNDIDRHPSDSDTRPYETWSYHNLQGGVLFIFVQRQLGGDYELVHSTHRNELHNDNWQRYIQTDH